MQGKILSMTQGYTKCHVRLRLRVTHIVVLNADSVLQLWSYMKCKLRARLRDQLRLRVTRRVMLDADSGLQAV